MRSVVPLLVAALACAIVPACNESEPTVATSESRSIGPDGGTIEAGALRITFPPGALAALTEFTITPTADGPTALGAAYRVSPQLSLAVPAVLEYTFTVAEVNGRDPTRLVIGRDIGGSYSPLPREGIDFDARVVTCTDDALATHYGLIVSSNIPGETDTDSDTDTDTDSGIDTNATGSGTVDPSTTTDDPTVTDTDSTTTDGSTTTGDGSTTTGDATTGPGECGDGSVNTGEVCFIEGLSFDAPAGPRAILATDLDGDSNADILVAGGTDNAIAVRSGNGTGILIADATYPVGTNPSSLLLSDLDGDGVDDLIVTLQGDQTVGVMIGAGDGTFGEAFTQPSYNAVT